LRASSGSASAPEKVVEPIAAAAIIGVGFIAVVRWRNVILAGCRNECDEDKDKNPSRPAEEIECHQN
jgi:hypothetical protein